MLTKLLLIVDDDEDDRFFFKNALDDVGGFDYMEAHDGLQALDYLRNVAVLPDFIFLDLNMPIMDGKECLQELKQDVKLKNIPVIIYTTSDYWKDKKATEELGASYYLNKTSELMMLPKKILKAMEMARVHIASLY